MWSYKKMVSILFNQGFRNLWVKNLRDMKTIITVTFMYYKKEECALQEIHSFWMFNIFDRTMICLHYNKKYSATSTVLRKKTERTNALLWGGQPITCKPQVVQEVRVCVACGRWGRWQGAEIRVAELICDTKKVRPHSIWWLHSCQMKDWTGNQYNAINKAVLVLELNVHNAQTEDVDTIYI